MDSGTYCRDYYSSKHVSTSCRHLNEDNQFITAGNRSYYTRFGIVVGHRRQNKYPTGYCLPTEANCQVCLGLWKRVTTTKSAIRDMGHPTVQDHTARIRTLCLTLRPMMRSTLARSKKYRHSVEKIKTDGAGVVACECNNYPNKAFTVRKSTKIQNRKKTKADR